MRRATGENKKLGDRQVWALRWLREEGEWSSRSGWCWDHPSGMVRILESLVKRGLVVVKMEPSPLWSDHKREVYRLNPRADIAGVLGEEKEAKRVEIQE